MAKMITGLGHTRNAQRPSLSRALLPSVLLLPLMSGCSGCDGGTSELDAMVALDARVRDVGTDATSDASSEDASSDSAADAFARDAGLGACISTERDVSEDIISSERPVSLVWQGDHFVSVWGQNTMDLTPQVRTATMNPGQEPVITTVPARGSAANVAARDGFVVWQDNLGTMTDFALFGARLEGDRTPFEVSAGGDHRFPAVARAGDNALLVAYSYRANSSSPWELRVKRAGDGAAAAVTVASITQPVAASIAKMGASYLVAWVNDGDVRVRVVSDTGAVSAESEVLNQEHNAYGSTALAFHESGGIVVFTVMEGQRSEVRARLLNLLGAPAHAESIVSAAPRFGRDPSVVSFEGGFAVVYRGRLTVGVPSALDEVRLAFVHGSDGYVPDGLDVRLGQGDYAVGPTGVAVSSAGQLMAGWAHLTQSGTTIISAEIDCPDAWLRCSPE